MESSWADPSTKLSEQLRKGEDELVLFDVGYLVYDLVTTAQRAWLEMEVARQKALDAALRQMATDHISHGDATADAAHVARVAIDLLTVADRDRLSLLDDEAAEAASVRACGQGNLRFHPRHPAAGWSDCQPLGIYKAANRPPAALFVATVYLRQYLAAWPDEVKAQWRKAIEQLPEPLRAALSASDAQVAAFMGRPTALPMPGVPDIYAFPDALWLLQQPSRAPWLQLQAMHAAILPREPASVRDAFLVVAHELATERSHSELLQALPAAAWQAKWQDAGQWLYLGLREIDALMAVSGESDRRGKPTVVVEPLPRTLAALRAATRMLTPGRDPLFSDLEQALRDQEAGREVDAERQGRLLAALTTWFGMTDCASGATTRLPGIEGTMRRSRPYLVRMPVRWHGETRQALALRLFVEREAKPGNWEPPPWGVELRPVAKPVVEGPLRK